MNQINYESSNGKSLRLNPVDGMSAIQLTEFLKSICDDGLSYEDKQELEDQLEAAVPALFELREAGHLKLNMRLIAENTTLDGFIRLAEDVRLSPLTKQRCRAIRDRMIVQGVKSLLGQTLN